MSNCCDPGPTARSVRAFSCPISHANGMPVDLQTVKAALTTQALGRLHLVTYRFCPDAACDVVYFDERGDCFRRADLRIAVWQKEPAGHRTICYCFGENEDEIRCELRRLGRSDAVARVRQHIQAGRCACDVRNPRGVCCLGELTMAVRNVTAALRDPA